MVRCVVLCCADNPEFKRRIAVAMALLVTSKLLTIQVGCQHSCIKCRITKQHTLASAYRCLYAS